MAERKMRGFRVADEKWEQFSEICEQEGITPSDAMRNLIQKVIDDEISVLDRSEKVTKRLKSALFGD